MKKFLLSILFVTVTSTVFAQLTVHVRLAENPAAPWVYAWDKNSNYSGGSLPGIELTDGPDNLGYFSFAFPAGFDLATANIIIHNGDGIQTVDIPISAEDFYYYNMYSDGSYYVGIPMCAPGLKCLNSLASVNSNIDLVIDNKVVKIVGASSVKIINISGVTVESSVVDGLEFVSQPLNSGLYIIVTDGKATKVIIK